MLEKYRSAVTNLSPAAERVLRTRHRLRHSLDLYDAAEEARLSQADLVLTLLRLGGPAALPDVERLVGKPILVLPGVHIRPLPIQPRKRATGPDEARVVRVARNPRLPTTPSFQRYQQFKPGRTIRELIARGVTRKDIRQARQAGWVEFAS